MRLEIAPVRLKLAIKRSKAVFKLSASVMVLPLLFSGPVSAEGLVSIMDKALLADPRISIADYQYRISEDQDRQALGAMLPQVRATANLSRNEQKSTASDGTPIHEHYDGEKYNLSLQQVVFNKSVFDSRDRTRHVIKQRDFEKNSTLGEVLLDVTERYIAVLAANDDLELVQSEKETVQKQLDQVTRLYEKQLVKVTDVLEVQTRMDMIQTDEIEAENSVQVAKESLTELINEPVDTLYSLQQDIKFPGLEHTVNHWMKKARSNNPQILAMDEAVRASLSRIEESKGGHYPTLDLVLSSQKSDVGFENSSTSRTDTNYLGLTLNVPLYSGGATSARIQEASNQWSLTQLERERTLRFVMKSTREAYLGAQSSLKRITASERSVLSAQKSYKAMNTSFKYGTVTVVDVINALQNEYQARRDLQQAKYNHINFWLRLVFFAGELEPSKLVKVNSWLESAEG